MVSRNWIRSIAILFVYFNSASSCCVNITVAVVNERSPVLDLPSQLNRTIGVIERAMNRTREILRDVAHVDFIIRNLDAPTCTNSHWGAILAELYYEKKIDAIIGPGCTNAVQLAARMASSWKIPILTYGGTGESSANKQEFTTLSRLAYTMNAFAHFYMKVFEAFGWFDIANMSDEVLYGSYMVGVSLQSSFKQHGLRSHLLSFNTGKTNMDTEILRVLHEARKISRVFLVSAHSDVFRRMVLLARQIGMEPGEYVFIFFVALKTDPLLGDFSWRRGDEFDMEAKAAYESVMAIGPRRPVTPEFLEFEKYAMERATDVYGYVWQTGAELNVFNIAHYDCFMLYAYAVNATHAAGEDPKDRTAVLSRMWNTTISGIGGMFYINPNGDRDADFSLIDLDPLTGDWKVVAEYLGYTQTFSMFRENLHWPYTGRPPANKPTCGFTGEMCISYQLPTYAIVTISFSAVIVVVLIIGGVVYRRIKSEADIYSQWWKIRWDDLSVQTAKQSFGSSCSEFRDSRSRSAATHTIVLKSAGFYRGSQVHIKKLRLKTLPVDRKLLLEIKQMRDVTCQNLTRLVGVCPDPSNVAIVTEFCSRGSLQDILHNDSIQLDWDFRLSLIIDIVQGMNYIHNSPIEVHGRLTSSRCVIDSRFVLKITGFGLLAIHECARRNKHHTDQTKLNSKLLWMAPELLRQYPHYKGTQSGDVYSFAIILYEMCTRCEPYVTEDWYLSLEDTIERIKKKTNGPTRPAFPDDSTLPEVKTLTENCWRENPDDRSTFAMIRKNVHSFRRGSKHGQTILDTLLQRMEQYANNLEGLVEERTRAFLEEKKKSEELLYQVLPRSVADQLRRGLSVIPEEFESVTIYFSDIVGFTAISAASTPFQVVDLLNDVYTCFDGTIDNFEVYKVETIGDAYMVVSGLPVRNGNEHARQIARMSLGILTQVRQFTIRHKPDTLLKVRIGIHTGPVCAGVVGRKMPRYCLFGDTVNTASRMESNGEEMKIHISSSTKHLLDTFGSFVTETRGVINVKGKGSMTTHWLLDDLVPNLVYQPLEIQQ